MIYAIKKLVNKDVTDVKEEHKEIFENEATTPPEMENRDAIEKLVNRDVTG